MKNKFKIDYKYLFIYSCLILQASAARSFSSGISRSNFGSGTISVGSGSSRSLGSSSNLIGSSYGLTNFGRNPRLSTFNQPAPFRPNYNMQMSSLSSEFNRNIKLQSNTNFISIADGKSGFRAGSNLLSNLPNRPSSFTLDFNPPLTSFSSPSNRPSFKTELGTPKFNSGVSPLPGNQIINIGDGKAELRTGSNAVQQPVLGLHNNSASNANNSEQFNANLQTFYNTFLNSTPNVTPKMNGNSLPKMHYFDPVLFSDLKLNSTETSHKNDTSINTKFSLMDFINNFPHLIALNQTADNARKQKEIKNPCLYHYKYAKNSNSGLKGSNGFSYLSALGLRGYTVPTIHRFGILKSQQDINKELQNEKPNYEKNQFIIIVVLVVIIATVGVFIFYIKKKH